MKNETEELQDMLTELDPPYESEEELKIGHLLDQYGIPFFYKQPMLVNESGQKTIEYADFFLPTYNGLALDYVVDAKSKIYLRKEQIYTQNQMQAVLVTRRDFYDKSWQSTLYKKLERLYHRRPVYRSSGSYR